MSWKKSITKNIYLCSICGYRYRFMDVAYLYSTTVVETSCPICGSTKISLQIIQIPISVGGTEYCTTKYD